MSTEIIAKNARLVWSTLKKAARRMTFIDLITKLELHATELAYAIGWLAKENKIYVFEEDGRQYFLALDGVSG